MKSYLMAICLTSVAVAGFGCALPKGVTPEAKRQYILQMRDNALNNLYADKPETKDEIANAPGYAVFSNAGGGFIVGGGSGYGVVVEKGSAQPVYMKMGQFSIALGLGWRDVNAVMIFKDAKTLHDFINEPLYVSGDGDVGFKFGTTGGGLSGSAPIAPVNVYQKDETALILRAALPFSKYYRYTELNP